MKKVILATVGILPLLAVACLYQFRAVENANYAATLPRQLQQRVVHRSEFQANQSRTSERALKSESQAQTSVAKLEEGMRRVAQGRTPSLRQEMVEMGMKLRGPIYEGLFLSWNLEQATQEEVLRVIRTREVELMEATQQLDESGLQGGQTWLESTRAIKDWSNTQLMVLLKEEQVRQLSREEAKFNANAAVNGMKLANKIAKSNE